MTSPALRAALSKVAARDLPDLVATGAFAKYQTNPAGFVREVLGIPTWPEDEYPGDNATYLWPHQRDILEAVAHVGRWADHPVRDHTSVATCHSIGKDFSAGALLVPWFLCSFEQSKVITTGPTDRQVRTVLWGELHKSFRNSRTQLPGRPNLQEWRITPDYFAIGFTSDPNDPEAAAGYHAPHILFIVDEASGISERVFEAIEGNVSTGDARLLLIGNPLSSSGTFYDSHNGHASSWKRIQLGYAETPNFQERDGSRPYFDGRGYPVVKASYFIQPDWVEKRRELWGEDSPLYQVRVLGHFPSEGTDTLIPLKFVQAAIERPRDRMNIEPVEIGVDVARFGDDETTLGARAGRRVVKLEAWSKRDLMTSAHHVRQVIWETGAVCCRVDVIGVGAGLFDRLCELQQEKLIPESCRLVPVNVAEAPRDAEHYRLLRDEVWFALAQRFRDEAIDELPDDPVLIGQLTATKYKFDGRGRLIVEEKADMKKRGLPSPDRAEALMLAFAPVGAPVPVSYVEQEMVDPGERGGEFFGNLWERQF